MEICPLAKSGEELILNLINSENNTEIAAEQLVLGTPAANSEGGNTALNVAAAEDAPWNKFVDVSYDRLDMATIFHNERAEISLPKGATPSDLVCHLNYTYGTAFKVDEFEIKPLEDGDLPELYEMKAKAENLAYTGTLQVFADLDRMPLSARLTVTDLNGFGYSAGGDIIVEHNKTMPDGFILGEGASGLTRYSYARNGEMFVGARAVWYRTQGSTAVFQPADYFGGEPAVYGAYSTANQYNNTIYRNAPRLLLFMGMLPGQDKFEHLLDGYIIDVEMIVSPNDQTKAVSRKGKVVRVAGQSYLEIVYEDGLKDRLSVVMQNGVPAYQVDSYIPYSPGNQFAALQQADVVTSNSPTNQRVAICVGYVTYNVVAQRTSGIAKPIELTFKVNLAGRTG
ncbi:hypothetical protein Xoosp14_133 [Xanthomonas phage Xoo-sp14]|nr:hypothetical protein Xoosp14_133 [Xanthomonas phage Xoo-sp14]